MFHPVERVISSLSVFQCHYLITHCTIESSHFYTKLKSHYATPGGKCKIHPVCFSRSESVYTQLLNETLEQMSLLPPKDGVGKIFFETKISCGKVLTINVTTCCKNWSLAMSRRRM